MDANARWNDVLARTAARCVLALCIAGTTVAGIQGSGFTRMAAVGVITSVDDITVNGTMYSSDHAHISVNGRPSDKTQLRVGEVVSIEGKVDANGRTGVADEISYAADVRGVITAVDEQAHTFSVLHQTVRISDDTLIAGQSGSASPASLTVGAIVEASGFSDSSGALLASRVEVLSQISAAQVRGSIVNLYPGAHTFFIHQLLVDYEGAHLEGALGEGETVLVQGDADSGMLVAREVKVLAALGAMAEQGDLEGIVTSFTSAADFQLEGQRVVADEKTHFILHDVALGPDVPVHVSGRFDGGVLVADRVEVRTNGPQK